MSLSVHSTLRLGGARTPGSEYGRHGMLSRAPFALRRGVLKNSQPPKARMRTPRLVGSTTSRERHSMKRLIPTALLAALAFASPAAADTATTTRSDGYQVTLTGPTTAMVGQPTTFTATCGPVGWYGSPCPYAQYRAFGGPVNNLGEGFGSGPTASYVFRASGSYSVRVRVGASCIGSPRLACPIDVWLYTVVTA